MKRHCAASHQNLTALSQTELFQPPKQPPCFFRSGAFGNRRLQLFRLICLNKHTVSTQLFQLAKFQYTVSLSVVQLKNIVSAGALLEVVQILIVRNSFLVPLSFFLGEMLQLQSA